MYFKLSPSIFYLFLSFFLLFPQAFAKEIKLNAILSLELNGPITPASYDYIATNTKKLNETEYQALLIKLNTPGGLVSTTKDILTLFGASEYPIIIWITPEGASATSAGALISSGAHFIFMSEGTNIGAATPIEMTGDIKESDGRNKAINDLVALVKGLSEIRNRNGNAFGEMISKAKSFTAREALKEKIIDGMANNQSELLQQLHDRKLLIKGQEITLVANAAQVEAKQMEFGQRVLSFFANPMMAYILFIIGAALIYLEFQAPGGYVAGGLGALCLVLAGIGFQIITINIGALLLITASLILFLLEIYVTSFGLLTIAGLAALITGSILLFKTEDSFIAINHVMMASVIFGVFLFIGFISYFFLKDITRPHQNFFTLVGKQARITTCDGHDGSHYAYHVKVDGEIWKAISSLSFSKGDRVSIIEHDKNKMTLTIK